MTQRETMMDVVLDAGAKKAKVLMSCCAVMGNRKTLTGG